MLMEKSEFATKFTHTKTRTVYILPIDFQPMTSIKPQQKSDGVLARISVG